MGGMAVTTQRCCFKGAASDAKIVSGVGPNEQAFRKQTILYVKCVKVQDARTTIRRRRVTETNDVILSQAFRKGSSTVLYTLMTKALSWVKLTL